MFLEDFRTVSMSMCPVREMCVRDAARSTTLERTAPKKSGRLSRTAWLIRRDNSRRSAALTNCRPTFNESNVKEEKDHEIPIHLQVKQARRHSSYPERNGRDGQVRGEDAEVRRCAGDRGMPAQRPRRQTAAL